MSPLDRRAIRDFQSRVHIVHDPVDREALIDAAAALADYAWLHERSSELALEMLARYLPRRPRVLELGGAPYFFTALTARAFDAEVVAANVEAATWPGAEQPGRRERVVLEAPGRDGRTEPLEIDVHVFNIEKDPFPFAADAFDAVLCMEVLEHLGYSPSHMLAEAHRVLKPRGLFFLTVPNFINIKRTVHMILNVPTEFPYSGYGIYGRHQREFAPDEVRRLLEANHYRLEALETANVWPTVRESRLKGLGNAVLNSVTRLPVPWLANKREYILAAARPVGDAVAAYPAWLYEHRQMYPPPPHGAPKVLLD